MVRDSQFPTRLLLAAVGVGGAPGGHLDEECANAGLQAIAAKLK